MADTARRVWPWLPLAGALAALGQAPVSWALCYLAGLVALIVALRGCGMRAALWRGWLWGAGYFAASLHWIIEPFLVDLARHGWMAPFALVLMAGGMALFPAFGAGAGAWLGRGGGPLRQVVALGVGLALAESLRAFALTGFPWADAAQAMIDTPLARLLPLGGPRLVGLAVLALAGGLALWRGRVAVPAALVGGAVLMAAGGHAPGPVDPAAPVVRIVQPAAPQNEKWDPRYIPVFFDRQIALTESSPAVDLVVWPEMSLPWLLESGAPALARMSFAAQGAPVVAGLPREGDVAFHNSLIVIGPEGTISDHYDKRHLVPFGEYIPLGDLLSRFGLRGLAVAEGGGFAAGQGVRLIDLPGVGPARPLICYEGVFAEEIAPAQRPRLLLLLTNDAWFGRRAGPLQHLVQARLRAIEQGLPMVRAANTGVAAMIDAHGTVVAQVPMGAPGAVDAPLPAALAPTPYARFGEKPALLLLVFTICALLLAKTRFHLAQDRRGG